MAQSGDSLLPGDVVTARVMSLIGNLNLQTGSVSFNGNLLVTMGYTLRTLASTDMLTLITADSPVTDTIGNLTGDRVTSANGQGIFRVTYGTSNNVVLGDYLPSALTFAVVQHSITPGPETDFETIIVISTTPAGASGNLAEFLRL